MSRLVIRDPARFGLSKGIDGSWRSGALDCFVCALRSLHSIGEVKMGHNSTFVPTFRDVHVWLYWAQMTEVKP